MTATTEFGTTKHQEQALQTLAEIGGGALRKNGINRDGKDWNVPLPIGSLKDGAKFLLEAHKAEEEPTVVSKTFNYRPWDGAYCANRVMEKFFGGGVAQKTMGMFGPEPPQTIAVNIGPGETVQVPWGDFILAQLPDSTISFGGASSRYGTIFRISVTCPKKYEAAVEGFFRLVEKECQEHSIYRGKAFVGAVESADTEFVDLRSFDSSKVVYSGQVYEQLDANVWTLVEQTERCVRLGQSLKRAVCVHGPYGTGKTLFTKETAKRCVANGWTFIIAKPGDDLGEVMNVARLYEPAVVVFEDIDTIARADQDDQAISRLLDVFDGLNAKDTRVITILTTNHPDKLHKGMLRPGRLDAMIEIAALDASGIQRLIEVTIGDQLDPEGVDFAKVVKAMEGYLPSFIAESCHVAIKYAIARTKGAGINDPVFIDGEALVSAANELRPQFDRMEDAKDNAHVPNLGDKLVELVEGSLVTILNDRVLTQRGMELAIEASR